MMDSTTIQRLRGLTTFPAIFAYFRDELGWPLESDNIKEEDFTFEYTPDELGVAKKHATGLKRIRQLRDLEADQPWAIFYIEFEHKNLPVTVLRSVLRKLTATREDLPGWNMEDLMFITVQGTTANRSVAFSHFRKTDDKRLPELRSFSWDSGESHFYYIKNLNLEKLHWRERNESVDAWRQRWRDAFLSRPKVVISESKELANAMAEQARFMRDAILDAYRTENDDGTWHTLMNHVQIELIQDLTPETFADVIAQTMTYGLFSAAEQNPDFELADLVDSIPKTNPFLQNLLAQLMGQSDDDTTADDADADDKEAPVKRPVDLIELGIDRLLALYREADVPQIATQFMRRTASGKEDPVILFYEDFLKAYDRVQRVERGVFYTPDPVVSYIVRSVDHILRDEFDIVDGLASAEKHDNGEHRVQILDPATGTGTFLTHIIDHVHDAKRSLSADAWNDYVAADLLPRLNGFELMMAPYAIAHMKIGLKLEQTGYRFQHEQRLRVYLTNALSAPTESKRVLSGDFLAQEADAAARVKNQHKIMVVIGNPPYSYESINTGEWISNLVDSYYFVDGEKLKERNPRGLQDDYVKFIRFGQHRINKTGSGILAFITNHGYLENPTFRGMRQSLMQTFDKIYVLDLHGNSKRKETTPEGNKDENVFDIMQGVSIGLFIKYGDERASESKKYADVLHHDLWGIRSEKYQALLKNAVKPEDFTELEVKKPFYLFKPLDSSLKNSWDNYYGLTDIYPTNSVGLYSARDEFAIQQSEETVYEIVQDFVALDTEAARDKYSLGKDSQDWKVHLAQEDVKNSGTSEANITPISYRPFDIQYTYYTGNSSGFLCRPREEVMQHMKQPDNIALCFVRRSRDQTVSNFYVARHIVDKSILSSLDNANVAPLYKYPVTDELFDTSEWELSEKGRRPNFDKAFVDDFAQRLGLRFIIDGRGDLVNTFGPDDIFHYAYAIFHSPTYRERYAEFLKIDFPRLPLTDNLLLFNQLVQRGADLVALHLLDEDYAAASWVLDDDDSPLQDTGVRFVEQAGRTVGKFSGTDKNYDAKKQRVYLDHRKRSEQSYFEGVPEAVWRFEIGGYQVLNKWLYDRRLTPSQDGRTLTDDDIEHYKRIVASVYHTMGLMDDIDSDIDAHGGYPIVGSQQLDEEETIDNLDTDYLFDYFADDTAPEDTGNKQMHPLNPDGIHIDTRYPTLESVLERMKRSTSDEKTPDGISLPPMTQRIADVWHERQQSRLIESVFLRIPLPAFYVAEDLDVANHWLVINGVAYLTALQKFAIDKKLQLRDLEFWGDELNGKTWDTLPSTLRLRLLETPLVVHIIKRDISEAIRFNVFRRINTDDMSPSAQEMRHALNPGRITRFLDKLANSEAFQQATGRRLSSRHRADRECVLRFIAFSEVSYRNYTDRDNLDTFLNRVMKAMNQPEARDRYPAIEAQFKKAMDAAYHIFGNNAFRKTNLDSDRRYPISKALFEVWSVVLSEQTDSELEQLKERREQLIKRYEDLQRNDDDFMRAISYSTGNTKQVKDRFKKIEDIVREVLDA